MPSRTSGFAYYLTKPPKSGGLAFTCRDMQNEIASGIFNRDKYDMSLIRKTSTLNAKQIVVEAERDAILIFPSKTLHATLPNQSDQPRISISGDITVMLKESQGFEHVMPSFKNWTALKP